MVHFSLLSAGGFTVVSATTGAVAGNTGSSLGARKATEPFFGFKRVHETQGDAAVLPPAQGPWGLSGLPLARKVPQEGKWEIRRRKLDRTPCPQNGNCE